MLRSILKADLSKLEQMNTIQLSAYEIKVCQEILEILAPFETATDQCQGQNIVTDSLVIPCIRGLKAEIEEMSATYKSKMMFTLTASLEKRLIKYEEEETFQLAAALDPR
jgi:hypothetical protein